MGSLSANLIGSIVCFWMLAQPSFPRVTPLPQYSQVMTISPNLGAMGAPQLGHLSEVAPVGARTGAFERPTRPAARTADPAECCAPHFMQ